MTNEQKVACEIYEGVWLRSESEDSALEVQQGIINTFKDKSVPPSFRVQYMGRWYNVSVKELETFYQ